MEVKQVIKKSTTPTIMNPPMKKSGQEGRRPVRARGRQVRKSVYRYLSKGVGHPQARKAHSGSHATPNANEGETASLALDG